MVKKACPFWKIRGLMKQTPQLVIHKKFQAQFSPSERSLFVQLCSPRARFVQVAFRKLCARFPQPSVRITRLVGALVVAQLGVALAAEDEGRQVVLRPRLARPG